jgi:hypothetical protein
MVKQFISGKRKQRLFTDLLPEQYVPATHLDQIELRELARAIDRLPPRRGLRFPPKYWPKSPTTNLPSKLAVLLER